MWLQYLVLEKKAKLVTFFKTRDHFLYIFFKVASAKSWKQSASFLVDSLCTV